MKNKFQLLAAAAMFAVFPAWAQAPKVVSAELSFSARGDGLAPLDSHFLGLSYEKSKLATGFFVDSDQGLVQLFNRLGHGVLRIGANAVDKTHWNANGKGSVTGEIAPSDVDHLAAFARRTGWKIVYGLNFATNDSVNMVSEATYAAHALGDQLESFEFGNEPDLYQYNGLRPTNYKYADFRKEWEAYAGAVKQAIPNCVFSGPATATGLEVFNTPFSKDEGPQVALLTHHYYRGNGQLPTSTIDLLLGGDPNLEQTFAGLLANSKSIKGGFRLGEANSFYNGGAPGVSNAFASALWAIDFLFQNALHHSSGVNFHGGNGPGANGGIPTEDGGAGYTPIADDQHGKILGVRPMYYGIYLFSRAADGDLLATHLQSENPDLVAYGLKKKNGGMSVVLINKSRALASRVNIRLDLKSRQGTALLLTAPLLESTSGYELGGSTFDTLGGWQGRLTPVIVSSGIATLEVPPASAILFETK